MIWRVGFREKGGGKIGVIKSSLFDETLPVSVKIQIERFIFPPCDGQSHLVADTCQFFLLVTDNHAYS